MQPAPSLSAVIHGYFTERVEFSSTEHVYTQDLMDDFNDFATEHRLGPIRMQDLRRLILDDREVGHMLTIYTKFSQGHPNRSLRTSGRSKTPPGRTYAGFAGLRFV